MMMGSSLLVEGGGGGVKDIHKVVRPNTRIARGSSNGF